MAESSGARDLRASAQENVPGHGARAGSFGTGKSALAEGARTFVRRRGDLGEGGYLSCRAAPFLLALLTAALVPKNRAAKRMTPTCATNNQGDVNQELVR